jgi:DNA polymerase-3 subunit delta'
VSALGHPDLHWFIPVPRPKATEPDKQVEEAAGLLAEALAERRANPVYGRPEGTTSHALASIRLLHRIVAVRPFQGPRRAVVLGNAERLVVQEASQEAANALLKVLEEPPPGTYLMLTTSEPQSLLPTIRSRLVPVRVGGVGDETVRAFLSREVKPALSRAAVEQRVAMAEGSIGRAAAGGADGDAGKAAERFLAAVRGGPHQWGRLALGQPPWAARGDFTAMLDGLAVRLRTGLVKRAVQDPAGARRVTAAIRHVEETRAAAQGNVNPQLAVAVLARRLGSLVT